VLAHTLELLGVVLVISVALGVVYGVLDPRIRYD